MTIRAVIFDLDGVIVSTDEIPYGTQFREPQQVANALSEATPVLLIQNDAVMTTGPSRLKTFDRLEVAEFTARSRLDTALIGSHVPIGDEEIEDLKQAFGLRGDGVDMTDRTLRFPPSPRRSRSPRARRSPRTPMAITTAWLTMRWSYQYLRQSELT